MSRGCTWLELSVVLRKLGLGVNAEDWNSGVLVFSGISASWVVLGTQSLMPKLGAGGRSREKTEE